MKDLLANIILSGTGASFVLMALSRIMPNSLLHSVFMKTGRFLTVNGRLRLGKTFWEKIEDFVENSVSVCWEGFRDGLNIDDEKSS